ncbi:ArsR/SmtB family transcription factor [Inconstantimicrobium porci]|uniref:ArsR/SmtB family transcription factor n=1 Tax=Inconstantimicrobium porci TaxID=2652291 RepID=UPI0012B2127F|nr:ArsR family transcriptional regulator [Inconstantimicrobium porci]
MSENNSFTGKELSEKLNLSKPTISHHIDILKEAGLINEERNKNSKLYSLNYKRMNDFIRVFSDKFKR